MQLNGKDLGWKTIASAVVIFIGAGIKALGYPEVSDLIIGLGGAFGLYGLRDAIAKK